MRTGEKAPSFQSKGNEREMSLIRSNVQENTREGSECALQHSTAIQPRQQPLSEERWRERCIMLTFQTVLQAERRSSQERTYENTDREGTIQCVWTLSRRSLIVTT